VVIAAATGIEKVHVPVGAEQEQGLSVGVCGGMTEGEYLPELLGDVDADPGVERVEQERQARLSIGSFGSEQQ
jgi:hypothetical protein